jgi:hypothetical protein
VQILGWSGVKDRRNSISLKMNGRCLKERYCCICRTNGNGTRTSLQNRDLLKFFHESTWELSDWKWRVLLPKAIQSASKNQSVPHDVKVRYAYYASDNPLETGSTLASGGLGTTGVKPTYLITIKILEQIFNVKIIIL